MGSFTLDLDIVGFLVVFAGVIGSFVATRKNVRFVQDMQVQQDKKLELLTQQVQDLRVAVAEFRAVFYAVERPHERGST